MRWILSPSRTTLLSLVALLITVTMLPAARADDRMVLQVYDVRDLLPSPPDFPAPRLGLGGLEAPVAIPDDDDDEREGGRWTVDELVELIRKMVSPASWGAAGARITAAEGVLVVLQQPQACRQVGRLLDDLRGRATELFQVDTRVVALPPPCIEELGFRPSKPRLSRTMARESAEERRDHPEHQHGPVLGDLEREEREPPRRLRADREAPLRE
ncbi:MAG: hypothetical protein ACE5GW_06820, partial [Planctomycetota bacterium]